MEEGTEIDKDSKSVKEKRCGNEERSMERRKGV